MAKALDRLKEILFRKNKKEQEERSAVIDEVMVDEIVKRVLERYKEEGTFVPSEEEVPESIKEIITVRTITSKTAPPLESHPSPFVRTVGSVYKRIRKIVDTLAEKLVNTQLMRKIDFDLYAANIKLTATQYVAIVLTISIILSIVSILILPLIARFVPLVILPTIPVAVFFLSLYLGLTYPYRKAVSRGQIMEKELPFALRHLAVVIRSGMSLYNALESIASARYKVLSEEFRRTLREISEGKTTEEALESLALRSHSKGMRRAVSQIIRALRIGGNLSDAIERIAEDLTFEQLMKVREFSEKLNLVGVVFMFAGIVFPTLLAILNGIGNAPLGTNLLAGFAMPLTTLIAIYVVGIPLFMLIILLFVKRSDPLGE